MRAMVTSIVIVIIINPWCMCESYGSHSVCVCLSVCVFVTMLNATYLAFFIEIQVLLGFPYGFQCMHCMDFAENALFKSSGNIL